MRKLEHYPQHYLLMQWLLFIITLIFALWLAWQYGFLAMVFQKDPTRISNIIGLVFLGGTVHCALRVWYLSFQFDYAMMLIKQGKRAHITTQESMLLFDGNAIKESLAATFLLDTLISHSRELKPNKQHSSDQLMQVLVEQVSGEHETGWFITGLLIKLGLLGTVVGFVLMLVSVADIGSIEFADLQDMISNMAVGMGVALTTTLVGLISSMLLGFQYLMLDRTADKLVSSTVHFANVYLYKNAEN